MKKIAIMAIAAVMLCSAPALAQETPQEKYLCELQAGNCVKRVDVVQRKIKKLESDIKKGKKVYSQDDLKQVEQKLKELEQLLDNLKAKQVK